MQHLPDSHPWLFKQFEENCFHVVRRSDRYWAGLSTDLVIEQTRGSLKHGSDMTENVRLLWTETVHQCAAVYSAMMSLTKMKTYMQESDHVDMSQSRVRGDIMDVQKLGAWFKTFDPFGQSDSYLCSLSSGATAQDNDGINCDSVEHVGAAIHQQLDGVSFTETTLRKKTK